MNNHVQRRFGVSTVAFLSLTVGWGISQAEEVSVAGIYSLVEVDGEQLPANSWTEKLDGERCKQVILKGVLLLDSEGRSAAFLTERVFCASEGDSENVGKEHSVIFAGSYTSSGNQIALQDDFGTDRAVVEGDILVYETGGEGQPTEKFVFRKQ
jgi:hypothetical protein